MPICVFLPELESKKIRISFLCSNKIYARPPSKNKIKYIVKRHKNNSVTSILSMLKIIF